MINAGTNQHLEKILSNLAEQEPFYLKNLFQYANKLLSAEPLVLNVLSASSNLSIMFMHLLHLAGDIYLVFAGIVHQ